MSLIIFSIAIEIKELKVKNLRVLTCRLIKINFT